LLATDGTDYTDYLLTQMSLTAKTRRRKASQRKCRLPKRLEDAEIICWRKLLSDELRQRPYDLQPKRFFQRLFFDFMTDEVKRIPFGEKSALFDASDNTQRSLQTWALTIPGFPSDGSPE